MSCIGLGISNHQSTKLDIVTEIGTLIKTSNISYISQYILLNSAMSISSALNSFSFRINLDHTMSAAKENLRTTIQFRRIARGESALNVTTESKAFSRPEEQVHCLIYFVYLLIYFVHLSIHSCIIYWSVYLFIY